MFENKNLKTHRKKAEHLGHVNQLYAWHVFHAAVDQMLIKYKYNYGHHNFGRMWHYIEQTVDDDHFVDFFLQLFGLVYITYFSICQETPLSRQILIRESNKAYVN